MSSDTEQAGPPDEWLALTQAERAEALQWIRGLDFDGMPPVISEASVESLKPVMVANDVPAPRSRAPSLADVAELAESLEPDDRMRLIGRLWQSLPSPKKAAVVAFGFENIQHREVAQPAPLPPIDPIWPKMWELLFDPTKTSGLYAAPRRFDLATIFVVTAAYSLLFGAMAALDFGPESKVAVAMVITLVGASQALFQKDANPRGVSIVAGAVSQSIVLILLKLFAPNLLPVPFIVVLVFFGLMFGAISGYLAGVLVGGVFLVADLMRKQFTQSESEPHDSEQANEPDSEQKGDSPWAS